MKISSVTIAAAVIVSLGAAGVAAASDQAGKADKDLGKLSVDGAAAYQDIGLARLAIYNGKTDDATRLVNDAMASLNRAKSDDAVFNKAESDLTPPKTAAAEATKTGARGQERDRLGAGRWRIHTRRDIGADIGQGRGGQRSQQAFAQRRARQGEGCAEGRLGGRGLCDDAGTADADHAGCSAGGEVVVPITNITRAGQQLRDAQMGVRYDTVEFQANPHAASRGHCQSERVTRFASGRL